MGTVELTGLEMTRTLASGAASAAALARSRTIEALVLKRSARCRGQTLSPKRKGMDGVLLTITGHAGLAGDTGGDEDDLGTLQGVAEAGGSGLVAGDGAVGVDVAQVGRDTYKTKESIPAC